MNKKPFTIIDCNNFWSPSGGGVRRYHLEKIEFYKKEASIQKVKYIMVQGSFERKTETLSSNVIIEHIPAFKIPGEWEYRYTLSPKYLIEIFNKYQVDLIEVGSPYFLPWVVRIAIQKLKHRPKVLGFWHADYPITYVKRSIDRFAAPISPFITQLSWFYAKHSFNWMDGIQVSSQFIMRRMQQNGLEKLHHIPLGVDTDFFHPSKADSDLIQKLKAGEPNRLTIFFPHRFMEEKGLRTLLKAYRHLCKNLPHDPALIFAGTGPDIHWVQKAVHKYPHIQYLGFIKSRDEMAKWYSSCDFGLALSAWETFGLSILESMASGQPIIGANSGAAKEHVHNSGAGFSIPPGAPVALIQSISNLPSGLEFQKLRQKARLYASQYSWANCFHSQLDLYREISNA